MPQPVKRYYKPYNITLPEWVDASTVLGIEQYCYLIGHPEEKGGLGKAGHFRKIVEILWGPSNPNKKFIWHPWAEEMNEAVHRNPWDGSLDPHTAISGCGKSGKCLAPSTPVLMFDGSIKKASEVKTGDRLMGDDSTPRTVLATNTGRSNMVQIIPTRGGMTWECNDDHILTLRRTWAGKKCQRRVGEIIDISVKDYLRQSKTFKSNRLMFSNGVEFPAQPIDFDPQMYGIWLGDGSTGKPQIHCHDQEAEVTAFIINYFSDNDYKIKKRYYGGECACYLISKTWRNNPFGELAKESSFLGEKRILQRYLINSRDVRLKLLAGIIDSDGHSSGTYFEICCSLDGLSEDIAFLARSLGFRVSITPRKTKCNGKLCHNNRIIITGNGLEEVPTLRKKVHAKTRWKNADATPFKIEQIGEGDWAGFTLDGNGRFLLGDFTVTHNTEFMGIFALVNWIVAPQRTLVLCTSTDLKAARKRIWGAVVAYFDALQNRSENWRLVDSQGVIRFVSENGAVDDRCGISLLAGERKHERDSIGKIIGSHNDRVFLMADELAELSPAILEAAFSNLTTNPFFQIVAASNFKNRYDPFGEFAEPVEGYDSITIDSDGWQTKFGHCVRFDGMKSPNLTLPKELWPIYNRKNLASHQKELGENTAGFWRMCRSFEAPIGVDDALYSESDFLAGNAYGPCEWADIPIKVSAMDPAFTQGGDRCVQWFINYGRRRDGVWTIQPYKMLVLRENVTLKKRTRNFQIADQFMRNCIEEGVDPEHAALDSTGAGSVLADIIWEIWSMKVLRVDFSGSPSTLIVDGTKTGKDKYDRKVSELWGVGAEFLRYGQWRGITASLARELKARNKEEVKGPMGLKIRVETKKDMKLRLGFSPDEADGFLIGVHLIRERLHAIPGTGQALRVQRDNSWQKAVRVAQAIYEDANYTESTVE